MNDKYETKEFLAKEIFNKASEASRNAKAIQLTIVVSCVVAFMALYNSLQNNWFQSRIKIHETQLKYLPYITSNSLPINLSDKELIFFQKAKQYYLDHNYSPTTLNESYMLLQKNSIENIILIKMPFIGTVFDINDLSVITGIGFTIMLFVAFYSLILKRNSLIIVHNYLKKFEGETLEKKTFYSLFKSNQTMTIVPDDLANIQFIRIIPLSFYFFPLAICILILVNDFRTYENGFKLSTESTIISFIVGTIAIMSVLYITIKCVGILHKIDLIWENVQKEYNNI